MTSCILAFISGSLVASVASLLYAVHMERVYNYKVHAARSSGYNDGLMVGKLQPMQREVRA